jgi:hypothetical protein
MTPNTQSFYFEPEPACLATSASYRSFLMDSPAHDGIASRQYGWETTLLGVIGVAIATMGLVTHLIPTHPPSDQNPSATSKFSSLQSLPAITTGTLALPPVKSGSQNKGHKVSSSRAPPSDPRVVVIGPNSIRGRFTLLGINRKPGISGSDELTLRLRVASLALPDLVTPFQSVMLEVRTEEQGPIQPEHEFSHPVPAGDHWDQDVVFNLPPNLRQTHAMLRIHYYPESKEIPLDLPPRTETR